MSPAAARSTSGPSHSDGAITAKANRGQLYLVNACANAHVLRTRPGAIDVVRERVTRLEQLSAKLLEERVRRGVEPILAGTAIPFDLPEDDLDYDVDLARSDTA